MAVLDTGIDNLPDFAGRLIGGVDLTGGDNPYQDSYGHGTFVAGLIAGDGASSSGQYSGEAPGANLVSIKVAGADGVTHLGTLISGPAVGHRSQGPLRHQGPQHLVGVPAPQSTVINPLDQAVRGGLELGYRRGGLGGQRRAVQRHHPFPWRRPAGDHGGRAG